MVQRNRALTGCGTCRSRHVKCDETRPICQNCQQQDLACLGYKRQLNWVEEDARHDADRIYRRPLFSGNSFISDASRVIANPLASD